MKLRLAKQGMYLAPQGEGSELGVPMWFIRLAGCSVVECPLHPVTTGLCDTNWKYDHSLDVEEIASQVPKSIHWVCITGGEPTDQLKAVELLVALLHKLNKRVNIQTSGIKVFPLVFDWVTVSPKVDSPSNLVVREGNELKLVYMNQDRLRLRAWVALTSFHRYYLQPLWNLDGTSNINEVGKLVCELGLEGLPWRMGIQSHKYAGLE
jgi:organic radical activating enzyme